MKLFTVWSFLADVVKIKQKLYITVIHFSVSMNKHTFSYKILRDKKKSEFTLINLCKEFK